MVEYEKKNIINLLKQYWMILSVVLLVISLTALLLFSKQYQPPKDIPSIAISAPSLGADGSSTIVTVYCDYLAPGCHTLHGALDSIVERYEYDVHFVFRQMPLETIHPGSTDMARIAVVGYAVGSFETVNRMLYEKQDKLSDMTQGEQLQFIRRELATTGVSDEVMKLYSAPSVQSQLDKDGRMFKEKQYIGVPTVELNGKKIDVFAGINSQDATIIQKQVTTNLTKLLDMHAPDNSEQDRHTCQAGFSASSKIVGEGPNRRTLSRIVDCG